MILTIRLSEWIGHTVNIKYLRQRTDPFSLQEFELPRGIYEVKDIFNPLPSFSSATTDDITERTISSIDWNSPVLSFTGNFFSTYLLGLQFMGDNSGTFTTKKNYKKLWIW